MSWFDRETLAEGYEYTWQTARSCSEQMPADRLAFAFGALANEALHPDERLPIKIRELEIACRLEVTS